VTANLFRKPESTFVQRNQTMKSLLIFLMFLSSEILFVSAQPFFPQQKINQCLKNISVSQTTANVDEGASGEPWPGSPARYFQQFPYHHPISIPLPQGNLRDLDTVVVGEVPHDTLLISGAWFNNGPVFVINDGVVIFDSAQATINGDLYVVHDAKVFSNNSSIYFPQQYFYQRSLLAANNARVELTATTLDYSGLSHSMAVTDSAFVRYRNVSVNGFTTTGLSYSGSFEVDTCDVVGEIICMEQSNLEVRQGETVLVWHHFPGASVIHRRFPDGDFVDSYEFTPGADGVSGIEYSVHLTNCTDVWWGLMPVNGCDVTIDSSEIRAIGAWFTGNESTAVSGLVNGSYYDDAGNFFSDRNLHLNESFVQTWSMYMMDTAAVTLTNCILGEVGTGSLSSVLAQNIFVDGSSGYYWADGQSFNVAALSAFTCTVRSQNSGILLVAYSGITNGAPQATGTSILILLQNGMSQEPEIYDAAEVWIGNLGNPVSAVVDDLIPINGTATIDKTAVSPLPSFGQYQLFFQQSGASVWEEMSGPKTTAVHDDVLDTWDTHGLQAGLYTLKLVLKSEFGDSVEAINTINLLPDFSAAEEQSAFSLVQLFPDPASEEIFVSGDLSEVNSITIISLEGRKIQKVFPAGNHTTLSIPVSGFAPGSYLMRLEYDDAFQIRHFIVQH
jgi:hypothetical protein